MAHTIKREDIKVAIPRTEEGDTIIEGGIPDYAVITVVGGSLRVEGPIGEHAVITVSGDFYGRDIGQYAEIRARGIRAIHLGAHAIAQSTEADVIFSGDIGDEAHIHSARNFFVLGTVGNNVSLFYGRANSSKDKILGEKSTDTTPPPPKTITWEEALRAAAADHARYYDRETYLKRLTPAETLPMGITRHPHANPLKGRTFVTRYTLPAVDHKQDHDFVALRNRLRKAGAFIEESKAITHNRTFEQVITVTGDGTEALEVAMEKEFRTYLAKYREQGKGM